MLNKYLTNDLHSCYDLSCSTSVSTHQCHSYWHKFLVMFQNIYCHNVFEHVFETYKSPHISPWYDNFKNQILTHTFFIACDNLCSIYC